MGSDTRLPDEIWATIFEYLDAKAIVRCQRVSRQLFKVARDTTLWKLKCFETAPSAARLREGRARVRLSSSGSSESSSEPLIDTSSDARASLATSHGRIAQRIAEWDCSAEHERVDWYNEYIARNAPLSVTWNERKEAEDDDICGVAVDPNSERAVTCQENGSVAIWDIRSHDNEMRKVRKITSGRARALFPALAGIAGSSKKPISSEFSGVTDCVTLDVTRNRAYVAVQQTLNEVDLGTLEVISQQEYAWRITAVSQQLEHEPISVGTSWSLHLYDPRMQVRDRSRSPEDLMRSTPGRPEESIAFLPNPSKEVDRADIRPSNPVASPSEFYRNGKWSSRWARVEPGPLSILHHREHEILVAGRFPSILSYDRRFFPRLQYSIHSGASLSSLSMSPYAPKRAQPGSPAETTLVACGEYKGRGSLELYGLPYSNASTRQSPDGISSNPRPDSATASVPYVNAEPAAAEPEESTNSYSYKNRQQASSAKLLSIATQGTRIVFSDAEGIIKWVERDGRGLARKFDLANQKQPYGTEPVARKIIPLSPGRQVQSAGSADSDLLIWTGENLGIVTTRPTYENHEELVKTIESRVDGEEVDERSLAEYGKAMRRALELQANERRWMSQFNRRLF